MLFIEHRVGTNIHNKLNLIVFEHGRPLVKHLRLHHDYLKLYIFFQHSFELKPQFSFEQSFPEQLNTMNKFETASTCLKFIWFLGIPILCRETNISVDSRKDFSRSDFLKKLFNVKSSISANRSLPNEFIKNTRTCNLLETMKDPTAYI